MEIIIKHSEEVLGISLKENKNINIKSEQLIDLLKYAYLIWKKSNSTND